MFSSFFGSSKPAADTPPPPPPAPVAPTKPADRGVCPWADCTCGAGCKCGSSCTCGKVPR